MYYCQCVLHECDGSWTRDENWTGRYLCDACLDFCEEG